MRLVAKDRIAAVAEVGNLRLIKDDAVLEFAGISHHHAVADDDVFAHVTSGAQMAVFADPGRALEHRALLDNRAPPNENRVAHIGFTNQLAEHGGLEPKLEVTRNLSERFPDIFFRLEEFRMLGVLELKIFGRGEHIARRDVLRSFQVPVRRTSTCPSFVSRTSQPQPWIASRNSSLFCQFLASRACTRSSARAAISAGGFSISASKAST